MRFYTHLAVDGTFVFRGIPPGTYHVRVSDAFVFDRPDDTLVTASMIVRWGDGGLGLQRAFADTTTELLVGESDGDQITISLKEKALPKKTGRPAEEEPDSLH